MRGDGLVAGAPRVTVRSTLTGHVSVPFRYGPDAGNSEIEVAIPGESTGRAFFTLFGVARDELDFARVGGQLTDDSSLALGGAGIRLWIGGAQVPAETRAFGFEV